MTTHRWPGTTPAGPDRSLATFLAYDQAACAAGVATLLATFAAITPDPLLLLEAAMVAAAGLGLRAARRPLRRGDHPAVVTWIAAVSWLAFIGPVVITPFVEPVILLAALLPVVISVPFVTRARLLVFAGCATATSAATLVLTRTHHLSDVPEAVPGWLRTGVVLVFVPFLTGLLGVISRHNHATLEHALDDARASRSRLAAGIDLERRRIERDLHDGAQQRLVGLLFDLAVARATLATDPARAGALLADAEDAAARAVAELRELAHGVYPATLTDHGLAAALASLAANSPLPCRFEPGDIDDVGEVGLEIESAVYFCCAEALQNASKHAGPGASVTLRLLPAAGRGLVFEVADDGRGFDPASVVPGRGLANLGDRVAATGGQLEVRASPGAGVTVRGEVPAQLPRLGHRP